MIQKKTRKKLELYPNVVMVGRGYKYKNGKKVSDEPVIVCSVKEKISKANLKDKDIIPTEINGLKTDVIEVGEIRALRTDRYRPAPGGVSIGHVDITAGTLGCLVQGKTSGETFILSNNHVLANCFDRKTEVLTKSGWKFWENVTYEDKFATREKNGNLEYHNPINLVKQWYDGKMFHFKGFWHDLLVTPNHNLFAKKSYICGLPKQMQHLKDYISYNFIKADEAFKRCAKKSSTVEMTSSFSWNCTPLSIITLPSVRYIRGKDLNSSYKIKPEVWLEFLGNYVKIAN